MLALDRSHAPHPAGASSSSSSNLSGARPGLATTRRTSSDMSTPPARSRSTPPVLPHGGAFGHHAGGNAHAAQQPQHLQQQQYYQQQHHRQQPFNGQPGWNPYGATQFAHQQFQQQQQQQQFFHQQQQQLAAWASVYQQQLMRSGSSPPVPFPGASPSPYGHPTDFPSRPSDPSRRRTSSGPGSQQRAASVDLAGTYFAQQQQQQQGQAGHYRHNSFTAHPQPFASSPQVPSPQQTVPSKHQPQQQQSQQQRQPSPPSSDPSSSATPPAQGGFHPYRRPERKPVPSSSPSSLSGGRDSPKPPTSAPAGSATDLGLPTRPYARQEGARSDSSVSSRSSGSRQPPTGQSHQQPQGRSRAPVLQATEHGRGPSLSSSSASGGSISSLKAVAAAPPTRPSTHYRTESGSSSPRAGGPPSAVPSPASGAGGAQTKIPGKPSPLSQSQAENGPLSPPLPTPASKPQAPSKAAADEQKKKKGFMSKLKGKGKPDPPPGSKANPLIRHVSGPASSSTSPSLGGPGTPPDDAFGARDDNDPASGGGQRGGLKRTRSLFNMKNASTDNISIASAASSASMMIRKIGSLGKLASRNSISGISSIFKDKKAKDMDDFEGAATAADKKKGLSFRSRKSPPTAAAVTHFNAELDREAGAGSAAAGLSPAARLARQHTIKSKEEDERRKAAAAAAAATASSAGGVSEDGRRPSLDVPSAWESNTAVRRDRPAELDDGFSDSTADDGERGSFDVDDVAARLADVDVDEGASYADWGRHPIVTPPVAPKSILKRQSSYASAVDDGRPDPARTHMRSNSSDQSVSATVVGTSGNVLNDIQPDANQIDGVHHPEPHAPTATASGLAPSLPPVLSLSSDPFSASFSPFDSAVPPPLSSPARDAESSSVVSDERTTFPYQNPAHNSSAPTLSLFTNSVASAFGHRSVTAPPGKRKEIAWAPNCAVYHTFHATEYDRRSEPATCNRLTSALAQEIKLFLNHYKMEEMEIHPLSKAHTHFFP